MVHSTQYLYALDPIILKNMNYVDAIKCKIGGAQKLLKNKLLVPHYTKRNTTRINAVYKAIKFNESLLEELKC